MEAEKPDFVGVTGDVVSGWKWDGKEKDWVTKKYEAFTKVMGDTYWAATAGNHDFEADLGREEWGEVARRQNKSLNDAYP